MKKYQPVARVGVGVIVKKNGKILLMKRRGSHASGTWAPPGGHIDFGESVVECARREVKEETGLEIKNLKVAGFTEDLFKKEKKHYITIWVTSDWKSGKVNEKHKEFSEIGWFKKEEFPRPASVFLKNYVKGKILP